MLSQNLCQVANGVYICTSAPLDLILDFPVVQWQHPLFWGVQVSELSEVYAQLLKFHLIDVNTQLLLH